MQATAIVIPKSQRIASIDMVRGLVMIIMALDHVRDFFHYPSFVYDPLDFSHTSVPIFLTRWITHFCAPTFVFLAGTSAYLTGLRRGKKELAKFLLTRGLWLVLLEVTIVNFGWSFDVYFSFTMLQTIWALGVGMIALSLLIFLPRRVLLAVALLLIVGHNSLDNIHVNGNDFEAFGWSILHDPKFFNFNPLHIFVAYPVLSWIGVMATGFCFGELYTIPDKDKRKNILIKIGSFCILLFIVLRFTNWYGDHDHWAVQKNNVFTFLSFINTTKYPPSLLYILMTLGPVILLLAFIEKPLTRLSSVIAVYGRVPMFFYILHIYFIHIAAIIAEKLSGYSWENISGANLGNPLPGFGFRLWVVYLVWMTIVALLYPLCKKYDKYKLDNRQKWWLSYL